MPSHEVWLDAYYVDTFEVTVAQYLELANDKSACPYHCFDYGDLDLLIKKSGSKWVPKSAAVADRPMAEIAWAHANDYCKWVGKRLCTEAEWEKAARGTQGQTFPWGDAPPTCCRAVMSGASGAGCGTGATWTVGSKPFGASPCGQGRRPEAGGGPDQETHREGVGSALPGLRWAVRHQSNRTYLNRCFSDGWGTRPRTFGRSR